MNRITNRWRLGLALSALLSVAAVAVATAPRAVADDDLQTDAPRVFRGTRDQLYVARRHAIPWSFASHRAHVPTGEETGFFIWHDRNTVHIESTDNHWF